MILTFCSYIFSDIVTYVAPSSAGYPHCLSIQDLIV